jgi:hypothetical protein
VMENWTLGESRKSRHDDPRAAALQSPCLGSRNRPSSRVTGNAFPTCALQPAPSLHVPRAYTSTCVWRSVALAHLGRQQHCVRMEHDALVCASSHLL